MRRPHASNRVDSNTTGQHKMDPTIKLHTQTISTRSIKSKIATSVTLIVLLSCYYLFESQTKSSSKKYGIIIDGGSTGTRIHVFGYRVESGGKTVFDFEEGALKVSPGLSAYAEDPGGAGGSVEELVEFGKGRVPRELWGETEVRLMATAGVRLLDLEVQDQILNECRRVLRKSGFKFQDSLASVITGSDEGLYAWVIANYALGALGGDPLETSGIIELGGASAQVTFVSTEPVPPEFSRTVKFGNISYNIYSHSFLQLGLNAALEALRESLVSEDNHLAAESLEKVIYMDPCTPKGYSHVVESWKLSPGSLTEKNRVVSTLHSRGNFSECRSAAFSLLQKGKERCSYQHCHIGSIFVPKLQGKFLATENFFHTSKFFGLDQRAFLLNLMIAGEQFCGEDWSRLKKKHRSFKDEDLALYCFSAAYIVALLHDSLGIAIDDQRIEFANQAGNIPLDWALGAFILHTNAALTWKSTLTVL
ncbi:ADENOSINE/GUANOSINE DIPHOSPHATASE [Salix koriyanagi]|uniref:ADENOSINE/GUANOSINE DIPHOSPHATASE n=1 Tax=Salix koriyanagi TaxID=2511006 RepID=A0A9Q1AI88_9ROSI|nr:ADENOSINE/GUANOSINE DIPHOSPHATASE [Salix koriyanagi]